MINPVSWNGHSISTYPYMAMLDESSLNLPDANPRTNETDNWLPVDDGNQMQARPIILKIEILDTSDLEARRKELTEWFDTQRGEPAYLTTLWSEEPRLRRTRCRVMGFEQVYNLVTIRLLMLDLYWETNDEESSTWDITDDGDTHEVTNHGNARTQPTLRIQMTGTPGNSWMYRRPIFIKNAGTTRLTRYPIELTNGGWNTAAIVKNAAIATAINDGDGITDSDTTITVDSTTGFRAAGLIAVGDEQILYTGKDATHFTGCVRGVNGTTAAAHLNDADVYQSDMNADGSDVRVVIDDQEVNFWWGAAAGAAGGPNHSASLIWAVLPDLPRLETDGSGGRAITLGTNLARSATATTNSARTGRPASSAINGNLGTNDFWQSMPGAGPYYLRIDMAESKKINFVRLLVGSGVARPRNFTVEVSTDDSSYTEKASSSASPDANTWLTYDFSECDARYVKINVTNTAGGITNDGVQIREVEIYHATSRVEIKYGNYLAGPALVDDSYKPLFELNTSSNTSWDFNVFSNPVEPYNSNIPPACHWHHDTSSPNQTRYTTSGGAGGAWPCTVMGIKTRTVEIDSRAMGWKISHPTGISGINFSGYTRQNPNYRRLRVYSINANGHKVTEYENTDDSYAVASPGTAFSENLTLTQTARQLLIHHWPRAATTSAMYMEVTDATVTLVGTPTVRPHDPISTEYMNVLIENTTQGKSFRLAGLLPLNTELDVNCGAFTVTEVASGVGRVGMLTEDEIDDFWLELLPGANTFEITSDEVTGMTIEFLYRSRWL